MVAQKVNERVRPVSPELVAELVPRSMLGQVDHVTLLPNRLRFIKDMAAHVRSPRPGPALVLVTLADARHFNEILRALGHGFADAFIRAGAQAIAGCLPAATQLYHVSVLSFAFVADGDPADRTRPPAPVQALVQALRRPLVCEDLPITTRAGIGVLALAPAPVSLAEALRSALAAAQDSRGRTQGWADYSRRSDEAHQRAFQMLTDLRRAMTVDHELSLVYQPRIDLRTGRTESAEALIRWAHPGLGAIPPSEFIPLAEATALMTPLTDWIFATVLRGMRAWPQAWEGVQVSVNISPSSLHQPEFASRLEALLAAFSVAPERMELEFTEGTLTSTDATVLDQIGKIRALGLTIAIDDFGTGYSNLDYLTRLPAQFLKIDQSFIRTMDLEPRRGILARSIIDLSHALGYRVVAEGIETGQTLDRLRDWGCDQGQGYFISRPLTETKFHNWLEDAQNQARLLSM